MAVALSIVAIVILILAIYLFGRTKATTRKRPPRPNKLGTAQPDSQFHAVSLEISGNACDAAQAIAGKRFLSNAAPQLPLPECDVGNCGCRYTHHKDRRVGVDRRKQYRKVLIGEQGPPIKEKRHRGDRRNDDPEDFFS